MVKWRVVGYSDCPTMMVSGLRLMRFSKMHGLGNDFVIVDARGKNEFEPGLVLALLGDRRRGIGYDQIARIENSTRFDARLSFWNADGSASATCGNATRCIARMLMDEAGTSSIVLETERGALMCRDAEDGLTSVNMGAPLFGWKDIPLAREMDSLSLPIEGDPVALGLGNPHCVFIVEDAETAPVGELGPQMEHHPLFPERTNVEFVSARSRDSIRMRIWERGTGITLASGSGACAAAVATARRSLTGRRVEVELDGGVLQVEWCDDGVWMTGPTTHVFDGVLSSDFARTG